MEVNYTIFDRFIRTHIELMIKITANILDTINDAACY